VTYSAGGRRRVPALRAALFSCLRRTLRRWHGPRSRSLDGSAFPGSIRPLRVYTGLWKSHQAAGKPSQTTSDSLALPVSDGRRNGRRHAPASRITGADRRSGLMNRDRPAWFVQTCINGTVGRRRLSELICIFLGTAQCQPTAWSGRQRGDFSPDQTPQPPHYPLPWPGPFRPLHPSAACCRKAWQELSRTERGFSQQNHAHNRSQSS
jgi:hypothetical protein